MRVIEQTILNRLGAFPQLTELPSGLLWKAPSGGSPGLGYWCQEELKRKLLGGKEEGTKDRDRTLPEDVF